MNDDEIKNFLYRIHFPCKKKKCRCDKIIKDAVKYIKNTVGEVNDEP